MDGLDPQTKLIVSWMIGGRDAETANLFLDDLQARLANRIQLTTDGLKLYIDAVAFAWFLGGLALIAAAMWLRGDARLVICLLVGSQYLFGAIANLWATRRANPGWILMMIALALIVADFGRSSE